MYISEIISKLYTEVRRDDSAQFAINKINDLHLHQLPVVDNGVYHGLISEDELLNGDETDSLSKYALEGQLVYLYHFQHVYDALQLFSNQKYDLIAVLDNDHRYQGVILAKDLLDALNGQFSNNESGAIIVLDMDAQDYALGQLVHLIESENAKILNFSSKFLQETNRIEMTIKLNKTNISPIIASLWRFNFVVKATFHDGTNKDDVLNRYDLLMNYLDL